MKYLHIMTNDIFGGPYIEFLAKNFDINEHIFIFFGELKHNKYIEEKYKNNILKIKNKKDIVNILRFIKSTYKSKKIFLHGLFYKKIVQFLFFQPWLLKKCNWVIWGGDLYSYQNPKITMKQKIYEYMRAFCIKRFGGLITYLKGDYELVKKWYKAKGKYYECFMYPSNLYKEVDLTIRDKEENKIYIQIGNSADPSNNHKEIIDKLKEHKEKNIEIICPLSYGNREYAEEIKILGENIFGNKFIALMDFIKFEEYLKILSKVDIAIFNHKRQQAMGNTITLLGLGKKIYIRNDVSQWELFNEKGIKVFDNNTIELKKIDYNTKKNNQRIVRRYFSEENLKIQWSKILNEI